MHNMIKASAASGSIPELLTQVPVESPSARHSSYSLLRRSPDTELEELWLDFLGRVKFPDLYATPHFFLEPHWKGKKVFAILAFNAGRVTGVLTGLEEGSQITCGLPSRPQMAIDPAGETGKTAATLARALVSEFPHARLITAYSWSGALATEFERRNFRVQQLEGDVVLDLGPGADALFESFHASRKRNIRIAIRKGVEVSEMTTDQDLAQYWDVFCGWLKTGRKRIHATGDFERAAAVHRLRTTHRRFIARVNGKAIAATLVRFYPGGLIEYSANCSLDEYHRIYPNDLLLWTTIQWACNHGFARYSFGAAHPFLTRCGGTVVPIYRYRLDRTFLQQVEMRERLNATGVYLLRGLRASRSAAANYCRRFRVS